MLRFVIAAVVAFLFVTYVALELNDVAVLHTRTETNSWRKTHVWVADAGGGSLWVEAATPDRPWLLELKRDSRVELEHDGATTKRRAVPVEDDGAREKVRALLREKYGWADRWVGLLQDTSQAVVVRLDPN